jgi:hypothetical protein
MIGPRRNRSWGAGGYCERTFWAIASARRDRDIVSSARLIFGHQQAGQ